MDLPWLPMALSSVAGSLLLVHKAPDYSISASAIKTFLVIETIHILLGLVWKIVLYPKLFSPLRHLPRPKVGSLSYPTRSLAKTYIAGWFIYQWAIQEDNSRAKWQPT